MADVWIFAIGFVGGISAFAVLFWAILCYLRDNPPRFGPW